MGLFFNSFFSDPIASTFNYAIIFFCLAGVGAFFSIKDSDDKRLVKFVAFTPSLLTTLGVIGTFCGILLGLLEFNTEAIDSSIQNLLDGVKISFTTSIMGMVTSVGFRVVTIIFDKSASSDVVTPADIRDAINQLKEAIQPKEESENSLIGQMKSLRIDIQDGNKKLISEFKSFKEHMVENTQKSIIEALEDVIRDFNVKITEQFGDNFKQLNEGVGKLVEWQDNYKDHIENLEKNFETSVNVIKSCEQAVLEMKDNALDLINTFQPLVEVLKAIKQQTDILHEQLDALSEVREQALTAFPVLEDNFNKLSEGFAKNVKEILHSLELSTDIWEQSQNDIRERHDELQEGQGKFLSMFEESQNQTLAMIKESIELNKTEAENNAERIKSNLEDLNNSMEEALTAAIKELGKQLASLNQKIIEDHRVFVSMVENLQQLLERAKYFLGEDDDDADQEDS